MPKRKLGNFKVIKLSSARLKRKSYNIEISYADAIKNGEIIKLGENELLSTVQRVLDKEVDFDKVEQLELKKKQIAKKRNSDVNREELKKIDGEINALTFVPEVISIVFSDKRHYQNLIDSGLYINDREYVRILAGAGNIRRNTVFFVSKDIYRPLLKILNNGRDETVKLNPAKFNAYFGLYASAGHRVSTPRIAVIKDYDFKRMAKINWIEKDDAVSIVEMEISLNPFDGQGMISPKMSGLWGDELEIEYSPATFIFRSPYCKGQLVTFDFHKFTREYDVKTSVDYWGNEFVIDDVDMILSESQFKMGDSYTSLQHYLYEMSVSGLGFRVSRYSPRELKNDSSTNYMFLQVLSLTDDNVKNVAKDTLDYFKDIESKNPLKTVLYLSGANAFPSDFSEDDFDNLDVLSKVLLLYPDIINERYFSQRIRNTLEKKEKQAKLGKLLVDGNYSPMVSDPFAMCQHLCRLPVTGLLKEDEFYSEHWNRKGVDKVATARSPLTHFSEKRTNNLVDNGLLEKWYKYLDTVFILPAIGLDTLFYADSDYDGDLIFSTSNETMLNCQRGGLPISYEHGKAEKVILTDKLICKSDLDSFNSKIGFITNTSSSLHSIIFEFEDGSPEKTEIERRLMLLRLFQGEAIDSGKNGGKIRNVPVSWTRYNKDSNALEKRIVASRRPYFTKYLYDGYGKKYRNEVDGYNKYCWSHYGKSFQEVLDSKSRTKDEQRTIDNYYKYSFFIFSDSSMNKVCRYVEDELDSLHSKTRNKNKEFDYKNLLSVKSFLPDETLLEEMNKVYIKYNSAKKALRNMGYGNDSLKKDIWYIITDAVSEGETISSNREELGNLAVSMMISNFRSAGFCWTVFGNHIVDNLKIRYGRQVKILVQDLFGDINFMFSQFSCEERFV